MDVFEELAGWFMKFSPEIDAHNNATEDKRTRDLDRDCYLHAHRSNVAYCPDLDREIARLEGKLKDLKERRQRLREKLVAMASLFVVVQGTRA